LKHKKNTFQPSTSTSSLFYSNKNKVFFFFHHFFLFRQKLSAFYANGKNFVSQRAILKNSLHRIDRIRQQKIYLFIKYKFRDVIKHFLRFDFGMLVQETSKYFHGRRINKQKLKVFFFFPFFCSCSVFHSHSVLL
jgi:hypothetical protein